MTLDWGFVHKAWENWADTSIGSSGKPLKAAMLLNYDPKGPARLLSVIVEQHGIKVKPFELQPFLDFIKRKNNLATSYFFIGSNQCKLFSSITMVFLFYFYYHIARHLVEISSTRNANYEL